MGLADWVILAVILGILGLSAFYIYRAKKSGKKCIGCPDSGSCSRNCCGCNKKCNEETEL